MSILSSTHTGRVQLIKAYFCDRYSTHDEKEVLFDIQYDQEIKDYVVELKPFSWNGRIRVEGESLPCKIWKFSRAPVMVKFENFYTRRQLEKIPDRFEDECINYEFKNCLFNSNCVSFVKKHLNHINNCTVFLDFDYKCNDCKLPYIQELECCGMNTLVYIQVLKKLNNNVWVRKTPYESDNVVYNNEICGIKTDFDVFYYRPIETDELLKLEDYRKENSFLFFV